MAFKNFVVICNLKSTYVIYYTHTELENLVMASHPCHTEDE